MLLITQSCGRTNNYRDEASRMGDGTFDRVHKIREVSSSDFLSETLTCVCLGATVRLWNSCYGLHAPVRFAYRYCIFRCSLPKAMSISRSEILRKKKAEETEVEKLPSVKVLESVS